MWAVQIVWILTKDAGNNEQGDFDKDQKSKREQIKPKLSFSQLFLYFTHSFFWCEKRQNILSKWVLFYPYPSNERIKKSKKLHNKFGVSGINVIVKEPLYNISACQTLYLIRQWRGQRAGSVVEDDVARRFEEFYYLHFKCSCRSGFSIHLFIAVVFTGLYSPSISVI